jgi:hypothetical protein
VSSYRWSPTLKVHSFCTPSARAAQGCAVAWGREVNYDSRSRGREGQCRYREGSEAGTTLFAIRGVRAAAVGCEEAKKPKTLLPPPIAPIVSSV